MGLSTVCYRVEADAVVLIVRLTPRASRSAVDGVATLADGRAAAIVRVRAPPVEGAANKALIEFLAKTFRVAKSAVTIDSGHNARLKQVRIEGDVAALSEAIAKWPKLG